MPDDNTPPTGAADTLASLLKAARLHEVFEQFVCLTQAPPEMSCVLLVARNLHDAFDVLPRYWQDAEAFSQWPQLADVLLANESLLRKEFGAGVEASPQLHGGAVNQRLHPLHGRGLEEHALYAMLCNSHEVERLRGSYAALQFQVLYARWAELEASGEVLPCAQSGLSADQDPCGGTVRGVRLPYPAARAVRYLSAAECSELLLFLEPNRTLGEFSKRCVVDKIPSGRGFASLYQIIRNYCERRTKARPGGTRRRTNQSGFGKRGTDYIEYSPYRLGTKIVALGSEEDSGVVQEAILETSISEAEALSLGLAPGEMTGGQVLLLSHVPKAKSEEEALQKARSYARRYEIDRTLYPWNSQAVHLDDFRYCILPALERASTDDGIPLDELMVATIVGCVVETGRNLEDVLALRVERLPSSEFVFEPAKGTSGCGYWNWWAIGPLYRSELRIPPDLEVPRSTYLQYPASSLISRLIDQYRRRSGVSVGLLFRKPVTDCNNAVKGWLRAHDPQRFTIGRLSHLRWTLLHQMTGGELASACLLFGLERTQARVELFYAVLSLQEATDLFNRSGRELWGESDAAQTQPAVTQTPDLDKFVGCRAFPRLQVVRDTVQWLQAGSKSFFSLRLSSFNPEIHADLLNRAVMYLVWHQMFAFATRAICDAYQSSDNISAESGLGVLRDKDFADGYKTRLVWAPPPLLDHMHALEQRIDRLAHQHYEPGDRPESPLWLLSPDKRPEQITPTSIARMLGDRFPFPVNTPRKVMRYLLRVNGMPHENAEMYMAHWFFGREPWSPLSSFDYPAYLRQLKTLIPRCLDAAGFNWIPLWRSK